MPSIRALLLLFISSQAQLAEDCAENFDANRDCFGFKSQPEFAELYSVEYRNYYKIFTNKKDNSTYVLHVRGTQPPNEVANLTLAVPLENVAVLDTPTLTFLEILGQQDTIRYIGSEEFISSACIQDLREQEVLATLADDSEQRDTALEEVEAVFSGAGGEVPNLVSVAATADPGMLKRSEWLKALAHFYLQEQSADTTHSEIASRYTCIRDTVADVGGTGKRVAWVGYFAPSDRNNNTPSWSGYDAQYRREATEDAGGVFLPGPGFVDNPQALHSLLQEADVIIDESWTGNSVEEFRENFQIPSDLESPALMNEEIYRADATVSAGGGSDFFESAVAFPNLVLQELVSVLGPNVVNVEEPQYFHKIGTDSRVQEECPNPQAEREVPGMTCDEVKSYAAENSSGALDTGFWVVALAGMALFQ